MAKSERSGHTTTDHDFIRQWVEERGGWPARVKGTGGKGDPGLIRVDFPGWSGEGSLERIEWEEWFQGFDANNLAFLHRDMSHGGDDLDRFNKLISRDNATDDGEGEGGSSRGRRGRSSVAASARSRSGTQKSSSTRSGSRSGGSSSRSSSDTGSSSRSSSKGKSGGGSTSSSRSQSSGGKAGTSMRSRGAAAEMEAQPSELRELLKHELGDLLFAERVFLQGTKTLAKEAQDPEVKARLEQHVQETEEHAQRIRQAFEAIGERAKAETCEAAKGLKEEHDSFKSEEKPSKFLLSAFDLGSGLRVEHYEIAAYRSTIALANALGERQCAEILKQNLDEELAMASFLEKTSRTLLKQMAGGVSRSTTSSRPNGSSRSSGSSRSGGSSRSSGGSSKSSGSSKSGTTRTASTRTSRSGGSRSRS
jgi:ferritin-like metal-binding protein YciE